MMLQAPFPFPLPDVTTVGVIVSIVASAVAIYRTLKKGAVDDKVGTSQAKDYGASAANELSEGVDRILGPLNERNSQLDKLLTDQAVEMLRRDESHKVEMKEITGKVDDLTKRLTDSETRERGMRHGIQVLIAQMDRAGMKPEYNPTFEEI